MSDPVITGHDVGAHLTALTQQLMAGDDAAATVIGRFYTPDIVVWNDGVRLDHDRLVRHMHPVRANLDGFRFDVHESVRQDQQIAARYTLTAHLRHGHTVATEIHMFAELAPDGRYRHVHQITRNLP